MESSPKTAEPRPAAPAQPSATIRTRHRNPRGQGTRLSEDIVAGALALIERTGSAEAVTLRAVAREAGIAAPSIYAHFPDRDAVLMAVVARIFDELTQAIEQAPAAARIRPAADRGLRGVRGLRPRTPRPLQRAVLHAAAGIAGLARAGPDRAGRRAGARIRGRVVRAPRPGHPGLGHRRGSASTDAAADATAVWVALHGTVTLRAALPRFPWPDPAASVRQLVLPLAKVTA